MALQKICTHNGNANEHVHLNPTETDSRLENRRHLYVVRHPPQPLSIQELNVVKWSNCQRNMRIHIHLFPTLTDEAAYTS